MQLSHSAARVSRAAAGGLLVAALFYAPWDSGGTDASAIRNLDWILGAMFALWGVSRMGDGRWKMEDGRSEDKGGGKGETRNAERGMQKQPHKGRRFQRVGVSAFLLFLITALLLLGWWMALDAHAVFDADYSVFLPFTSPLPNAPGSVDYFLSVAMMWRATTLLGYIWVMASLAQDARWLLRIWWAIGLAGGSIALLGLVQKATGAQMIFWQTLDRGEPAVHTFFATFYYHGNAGAYLNLALPAVLGLAFRYVTRPANPFARALWLTLSVIMIVAVASDTSRMGQFIAALMALTLLVLSTRKISRSVRYMEWRTALIALVVGVVAFWAIVQTSHLDRSLGRWEQTRATWERDARWVVDRVAIKALPQAGALGFGPGTFSAVFPQLQQGADERAQGSWLFLHDDYLQTLLEWGWVGGLLWAGLFFGGIIVALRSLAGRPHPNPLPRGEGKAWLRASDRHEGVQWLPRQRMVLSLALVALGGVALHAAVDFPLQISSIQLYAATYLGVCWGAGRWPRQRVSS